MFVSDAIDLAKTMEIVPGWWMEVEPSSTPGHIDVRVCFHNHDSRYEGDGEPPLHVFKTPPEAIKFEDVDDTGLSARLDELVIAVFRHELREFTRIRRDGDMCRVFDPHSDAGRRNWAATRGLVPRESVEPLKEVPGYAMMPEIVDDSHLAGILGACPNHDSEPAE